jgi:DNA-binding CsgD family transcriptional regulator
VRTAHSPSTQEPNGLPTRSDVVLVTVLLIAAAPVAVTDVVPVGIDLSAWGPDRSVGAAAVLLAVAQVFPLWWRRRHPFVVAAAVGAAFLGHTLVGTAASAADVSLLFAVDAVGAYGRSRLGMAAVATAGLVISTSLAALDPAPEPPRAVATVTMWALLVAAPMTVGLLRRHRASRPAAAAALPVSARELTAAGVRAAVERSGDPRLASLTPRERDVLVLLAEGMSNADIAEELGFGYETSKKHVAGILTKLGVPDRTRAALFAVRAAAADQATASSGE